MFGSEAPDHHLVLGTRGRESAAWLGDCLLVFHSRRRQNQWMTVDSTVWRPCSSCKKSIAFKALYWICNVSTCNRKRTGLIFCNVSCWDAHVPQMNHRESWAVEKKAPTREEWAEILAEENAPKKRSAKAPATPATEKAASIQNPVMGLPPKTIIRRGSAGS